MARLCLQAMLEGGIWATRSSRLALSFNCRHRRSIASFEYQHHANAFSVLPTNVDTSSAEFKDNASHMGRLIEHLGQIHSQVQQGGPAKACAKHLAKGKLLPRDRITALIDPGSSFLELSPLAGHGLYDGHEIPAAGIITGVGVIHGRRCMVVANDSTVKGGTYYPITVKKHLRAQTIAQENNLPCVYLVDSGGANLPFQADVFPDAHHFGRIFFNQAQMSATGLPQVSVVMGPCTAGGAYVPAMSDETIIVENQGTIFLGGPPLVKAATGEEISAEELGGGRMHCSVSGVADYLAVDDAHALALARRSMGNLSRPTGASSIPEWKEPLYESQELNGIIGSSVKQPLPVREIIARVLDGSELAEFKKDFGTTLVTGFGRLFGYQVGIVANDGILFSESALKGSHFIQLCAQRDVPIIFLQNITGFMVGGDAERGGIAKDGAKLVTAVACASNVPKLTVILGSSNGAGNYGMCGRAYDPRMLFMWPNAKIGVMGAEQLSAVMETVGKSVDPALKSRIESESEAIFSSARLWDDGIIMPSSTRFVLGEALRTAMESRGPRKDAKFGIFRM